VEVRKILTKRPVDLVLLDSDYADGEAVAWLKELKTQWPQTGYLFIGDSTRQLIAALAEGADAVLRRGFQIEDLSAAIERIIQPRC
jgi:DNA-binding response OmpR family regulator